MSETRSWLEVCGFCLCVDCSSWWAEMGDGALGSGHRTMQDRRAFLSSAPKLIHSVHTKPDQKRISYNDNIDV